MESVQRADRGASTVVRRTAINTQRRKWRKAASHWDSHAGHDLGSVVAVVLEEAKRSEPVAVAIDVGAGTGAVAVPLAHSAGKVIALDVSEAMLARLETRAKDEGLDNVEMVLAPIEQFDCEPGTVDLVVSNYALHHLLDADKQRFVKSAARWLRPGGRLVIGDMMFGRGSSADDRQIIASKVRSMAARGPAGWWRIAKNAWRYLTRSSERPISMERWTALLEQAGFSDITTRRVVSEAAVVCGRLP